MENVEVKARCADAPAMARAIAAAGGRLCGTLEQIDTYFNVQNGRLKLRVENGTSTALIFYLRPDLNAPKTSRYELIEIAPAQRIGEVLEQSLGIKTVVRKRRQLWRRDNIRIHLDHVQGLGWFIEFEVEVLPGREINGCRAQAHALLKQLGITESDLIAGSYSDLMP